MKRINLTLLVLSLFPIDLQAQIQSAREKSTGPLRPPIQIEDPVQPLGTLRYWLRVPTGNNAEVTFEAGSDDSYNKNMFVAVGRFWFYGGGFEPTPDGYGKLKEGTRVLASKSTRFGFEIGKDGVPTTYLINNKPVPTLLGFGRYRFLRTESGNVWYDIYTGEKVQPQSKDLEALHLDDGKGNTRDIPLVDFIKIYQEALNTAHNTDEAYVAQLRRHEDALDRLAVAIAYCSTQKVIQDPALAKEAYTDPKGFFKIIPPKGWQKQQYPEDPRGKVAFIAPGSQTALRVLAKVVGTPDYETLIRHLKDVEKQLGVETNIEPTVFNRMPAVKRLATVTAQGVTLELFWIDLLVDGVSHNIQYSAPPSLFEKHRDTAWKSMLTYEPLNRTEPVSPEEARKHEAAKWIRLAKIALEMEKAGAAKEAIAAGLEVDPDNTELKQMKAALEKK